MADYRQLLTKAISALSENNGAQRREVYEKARKALVAQLRSISPPLPAREITQHRLELEDCIRQVEQEATENILGGLKQLDDEPIPSAPVPDPTPTSTAPEPVAPESVAPEPVAPEPSQPVVEDKPVEQPVPASDPQPHTQVPATPEEVVEPAPEKPSEDVVVPDEPIEDAATKGSADTDTSAPEPEGEDDQDDVSSIDAIIARAEAARAHSPADEPEPVRPAPVADPSAAQGPVAPTPAEPAPAQPTSAQTTPVESTPVEPAPVEPAPVEFQPVAAGPLAEASAAQHSAEPSPNNVLSKPAGEEHTDSMVSDRAVGAAMSQVRQVEVEAPFAQRAVAENAILPGTEMDAPNTSGSDDSQLAIDRAIEMLDREARGEDSENGEDEPSETAIVPDDTESEAPRSDADVVAGESRFVSDGDDEKSGNALTIFLVLAVVLLAAVGGGGYWAAREGYIDLDALFAQANVTAPSTPETPPAETPVDSGTSASDGGPGNTATDSNVVTPTEELTTEEEAKSDERLSGADENQVPAAQTPDDGDKVEDRLTTETPAAPDPSIDADSADGDAVTAGAAQSLLLEASADGTTGAVPFSGTVDWERGTDEEGQPTLMGSANIPARNMGVSVLIRRNADPTLPASHLVEVEFDTSETFVGGSIASFGGILFKNEELVPGRPLVGAPARVFENMFLFALSAAEQDVRTNLPLIENNKWMDLAIIYGTGRQAIITLEKDDEAQQLFEDVLGAWAESDQAAAETDSTPSSNE